MNAQVTHTPDTRNAREQLEACADWLGWQDENLSAGLRKPEDGLKLWRYWQARPSELPEMADEETDEFSNDFVARHRKRALGYDPLGKAAQTKAYARLLGANAAIASATGA